MSQRSPKRHRTTVEVYVDVDVEDVLSEAGDDQVKAEYVERFGAFCAVAPIDLVEDIRDELIGGRAQAALALCEGHLNAARITDERRQAQYQAAGRAH